MLRKIMIFTLLMPFNSDSMEKPSEARVMTTAEMPAYSALIEYLGTEFKLQPFTACQFVTRIGVNNLDEFNKFKSDATSETCPIARRQLHRHMTNFFAREAGAAEGEARKLATKFTGIESE